MKYIGYFIKQMQARAVKMPSDMIQAFKAGYQFQNGSRLDSRKQQ